MARRLISLTEAAGTPEGGKVLGQGSAQMDAVLSIGPYDAEQAAGVESGPSLPVLLPLQETSGTGRACCGFAGAASRHEGERGLRGRSRDILVRTA